MEERKTLRVAFGSVKVICWVRMLSFVVYAKELVDFLWEKIHLFSTKSEKGPTEDPVYGPRLCVVRPRVSRLYTVSTSSDEGSWRFYRPELSDEEEDLPIELYSDSEAEEGEEEEDRGVEGFVWNFHNGGRWNGWNEFE